MNWVDRSEAIARLGIKPQTLYAYVSRGLVTAQPHPDDPRASLYAEADIQRLISRRRSGRARKAIAQAAIAWGDPIMETQITTVRGGRLIYRETDAVRFAETATLEDTAALLWAVPAVTPPAPTPAAVPQSDTGKARAMQYLARQAASDWPRDFEAPDTLAERGSALLSGLCSAITGVAGRGLFHQRLSRSWQLDPRGVDIVRRALVLVADHELNPSTFAARVAASTGASLAASALSGFATLTGPQHGEASALALAYLRDALANGTAATAARLQVEQRPIPATGHGLYPEGDPRALALLEWMRPDPPLARVIAEAERARGERANIDMALAAMTLQFGLPDDAPFQIFASGRMVGWIAHAAEQRASGRMIRPRAQYQSSSLA